MAVLSGGVFQNLVLLRLTRAELERRGLRVLVPRLLPPNDGGISYGQAAIAAARGRCSGSTTRSRGSARAASWWRLRWRCCWRRGYFHVHVHSHGEIRHAHPHMHEGSHASEHAHSHGTSFGIGLLHGAGGSAGVGVLLVAAMPGPAERVAALVVFALGTAASMATVSAGFGYALGRGPLLRRFERIAPVLGTLSLVFGLWYVLGAIDAVPYAL